eukprot:5891012-Prymnesium_polylepis.1
MPSPAHAHSIQRFHTYERSRTLNRHVPRRPPPSPAGSIPEAFQQNFLSLVKGICAGCPDAAVVPSCVLV